jgi:hypothetical protein
MDALHPRIAEVVDELEDSHRELVTLVASIPEDRRDLAASDSRWSIAQQIEHLAIVEDGIGRLLSKLIKQVVAVDARETHTESIRHAIDHLRVVKPIHRIVAPEGVAPTGEVTAGDALERLTAARTRVIGAVQSASGYDLSSVSAPHPILGPLTAYQWALFVAHHERRHLTQIRAVAGMADA